MKRSAVKTHNGFMRGHMIIKYILLASGVLLIGYCLIMAFLINFDISLLLMSALGVLFVLLAVFYNIVQKHTFAVVFLWVTVAITCILMVFAVCIALYGIRDDSAHDEDVAIVLGCGINGETVSRHLSERLDAAADYYKVNPNAVIVVSGGQGPQESISEALAMERYLVDRGVPSDRIIKEEASTSTYTNLLYSKAILDEHFKGQYRSVIITSDYHIYRAADISDDLGLNSSHIHGSTVWYEAPIRYFREILAILKNAFNNKKRG